MPGFLFHNLSLPPFPADIIKVIVFNLFNFIVLYNNTVAMGQNCLSGGNGLGKPSLEINYSD